MATRGGGGGAGCATGIATVLDGTGTGEGVASRGGRCDACESGTGGKAVSDLAMAEVVRGVASAADAARARIATTAASLYNNRKLINYDNAVRAQGIRAASGY